MEWHQRTPPNVVSELPENKRRKKVEEEEIVTDKEEEKEEEEEERKMEEKGATGGKEEFEDEDQEIEVDKLSIIMEEYNMYSRLERKKKTRRKGRNMKRRETTPKC